MEIKIRNKVELDDPYLLEGLPGVGLVAKIAADHIIEQLDMDLYAEVYGRDLPHIAVFEEDERGIKPAMRMYVSAEHDLIVLKSEATVSAQAGEFVHDFVDWMGEQDITPIFQLGLPSERDEDDPELFGAGLGAGGDALDDAEIDTPPLGGGIAGPTGGLIYAAMEKDLDCIALTVQSHPWLPDPTAARVLIDSGIEKIVDFDIGTDQLTEAADQIREQEQQLAEMVKEAQRGETSQAYPTDMYR